MPSVIINDVAMEAKVGERLLNVARRNAAHIGFVCDGNGLRRARDEAGRLAGLYGRSDGTVRS